MDSIIFDVDGTLWDSTEICAKAWTDAIHRETDLSLTIDAPTLKGLFGRLLPDIASVLFADYPMIAVPTLCGMLICLVVATCARGLGLG